MPIDLFCVIHGDSRKILLANLSFEYLLGWKSDEVIGQSFDAFTNAETDIPSIEKSFSKIKLGVHTLTFETSFRTKNNLMRDIDWRCYVDNEQQHVFAIGRDITTQKEAQRNLAQQSQIDPTTNIPSRQTFLTLLENELSGATRYHYATALMMVDIDHFKNYNERFGLQKGDDCLRQVAMALKSYLRRKTDFLARFENDSFVVLLSHNDLEKGIKSAEYLRSSLEKLAVHHDGEEGHQPITISIGVTAISDKFQGLITPDLFLASARKALNIGQQRGGNQINYSEEFQS